MSRIGAVNHLSFKRVSRASGVVAGASAVDLPLQRLSSGTHHATASEHHAVEAALGMSSHALSISADSAPLAIPLKEGSIANLQRRLRTSVRIVQRVHVAINGEMFGAPLIDDLGVSTSPRAQTLTK